MGIAVTSTQGAISLDAELKGLMSADQAERNSSFIQLTNKLGLSERSFNISAVQDIVDGVSSRRLNISRDHGLNIVAATVKSMDDGMISSDERLGTANVKTNQVTIGRISAAIIQKDAGYYGRENELGDALKYGRPVKVDMAMPATDITPELRKATKKAIDDLRLAPLAAAEVGSKQQTGGKGLA